MIVAAAIRKDKGTVFTLPAPARHHDVIHHMVHVVGYEPPIRDEQGFVDDRGRFYNRAAAYAHAVACGQLQSVNAHVPGRLFSEDLW